MRALTDASGGLESAHDRHPDVEQDDREFLRHDTAQRRKPGVGLDDRVAERRQHGLQRQPLAGMVVDHQDRNAHPVCHRAASGSGAAGSHGLIAVKSWLVSTGFGT